MTTTINNKHKKLNVPNLRFPEFQGEWEKCILGDITENFNLRNKDKIQYPMFSVTNDRGFVPQSEQFEGRDMVGEDIKAYKIIHTNDFAYNPARINVGSIAMYTGERPCMISSLYVCFKTTKEVNNEWLMQLLKTPKMNYYYNVNGEGGVRVYLFYPNFARIRMSIPKIEEQKKIAKLLNLIDERIATQNKIIDKLQSLIKGIAQHCIRELINGWEYVRLSDICKITTGKLDANAQVENGQYPFFTCAERPFNIDSYAFDTEALLISGNGANLGYINYYKGKFNAYQRTYVLDHFSVNIQYVKWALKVLLPQRIAIEKSSSNTPYIVLSTLADLKIPIPNNSKQNHIANLMQSFEGELSNQLALNDLYNKQKQYLLRQMFI